MTPPTPQNAPQPPAKRGEGAISQPLPPTVAPRVDMEASIARLHQIYCEKTETAPRLVFSRELWARLLQVYECDAPALAADLQLVIRYLKKQIAADKRNPGSLKLANLLRTDQFDADVTEARIVMPPPKKPAASALPPVRPVTQDEHEETARIMAEQKRQYPHLFRNEKSSDLRTETVETASSANRRFAAKPGSANVSGARAQSGAGGGAEPGLTWMRSLPLV